MENNKLYRNLNRVFITLFVIAYVLLLMPVEYKMGVYTPSLLGFILILICLLGIPIPFLYLLIVDTKRSQISKSLIRLLLIIGFIATYFILFIIKN